MKLIDLDEFFRQNCIDRMDGKSCEECKHHVLEVSCERLMEQPTIDAVKVVRCKDCRHFFRDDMGNVVVYRCELNHEDMRDDFYCADGERGEDE